MNTPSDATRIVPRLGPGTRLSGIYVVDSLIASGGMGDVYRGRAIETDIEVAIKVIRPELAGNEMILALFRKEAAALHNTQHDAIVRYYVFATDPDLRAPYLAMELVEGESLLSILGRGRMPIGEVLALQQRIGSALAAAHKSGIVHRDVSPDNIILPDGDVSRAKLIDFGIARTAHGGATVIGNAFAGKQNYASPEQVGLFGATVGPKSDVYSFGLTLAAALQGAPLDMGSTQFEAVRRREVLPDLGEVDPEIRPLLERMLQPDPQNRPTGLELAAWALPKPEAAPARTPAPAPVPASGPAPARAAAAAPPRGRLVPMIAAAVVLLLAAAGLVGWFSLGQRSAAPPSGPQASLENPLSPTLAERPREPVPAPVETPRAPPASEAAPAPAAPPAPAPVETRAPAPPREATPPPPAAVVEAAPPPAAIPTAPAAAVAAAPAPVPAEAGLRDCAECPELVAIPAGRFRMGSMADATEQPVHEVRVAGFAAGRSPVTVREWRLCVEQKGCELAVAGEPSEPVHNVSWTDAQGYVAWLSRVSGRNYRLLTEAEWEYAARAGASTRYWWGDEFREDRASCRGCGGPTARTPPPVGRFPANPFGLFDVTGSVDQWVQDCWHKDYRRAPADGSAWIGPQCRERVLRGGSWNQDRASLRVSGRESYDGAVRYPGHGLRVARDM